MTLRVGSWTRRTKLGLQRRWRMLSSIGAPEPTLSAQTHQLPVVGRDLPHRQRRLLLQQQQRQQQQPPPALPMIAHILLFSLGLQTLTWTLMQLALIAATVAQTVRSRGLRRSSRVGSASSSRASSRAAATTRIRSRSSAAAAAAFSTTTSSGGKEDNTNKLSAADKELHRVASEGAPFPRFHDTTPISATEALTQIRNTHNGPLYAHVSPHLREVIYEGKLLYPDWAVPRTALEAQAAKERELHGDTIKLSKEGRLSTSAALPHRSLPDLLSYFDAFVSTIGPALFDRPRALLDWFMLSRSVLNIMKSEGDWAIANKYLMTTLSEKVPLRKEFGEFDMRIMHAVAPPIGSMHNHRNNNNNYSSNSGSNGGDSTPSSRTSFLHLVRTECCRKWNFASCKEPCPMGRTHACLWKACSEGNAHTGRKCNHNPDPRSDSMIGPAPPGKGRFPRRA